MLKTATPKEIITFSALLRIPNTYTDEQKKQRVSNIIDELNIANCQNTQVGAPGLQRGISGGERKRVSIGMELVTNPSLLFLDEVMLEGIEFLCGFSPLQVWTASLLSKLSKRCAIWPPLGGLLWQLFTSLIRISSSYSIN